MALNTIQVTNFTKKQEALLVLNTVLFEQPRNLCEIVDTYQVLDTIQKNFIQITQRYAWSDWMQRQVKQAFANAPKLLHLAHKEGGQVVFFGDPLYPSLLAEIYDPPMVLYTKGDVSLLQYPQLGVVGPRTISDYGDKVCEAIISGLLGRLVITSGLAKGVDTKAHATALASKEKTIAVLGTDLGTCYPSSNRALYDDIVKSGCIITEIPPRTLGHKRFFPRRNRLISGLSLGVLVVEASQKSGSLITARCALEQNREVFAIPGSIFSSQCAGVNRLIQDGAVLTDHSDIVLETLNMGTEGLPLILEAQPTPSVAKFDNLTDPEKKLVSIFSYTPITLDEIVAKSSLMVSEIMQYLTLLEMKDIITTAPGGTYKLT